MEKISEDDFLLLFQRDDFSEFYDLGEYYSIAEPIIFTNKTYNNKSIIILNRLVFEQDVLFDKTNINVALVFRNCEFKKGLLFDGLKSNGILDEWDSDLFGLHFENCIFNEMVQFEGRCEVERGISFTNDCQIKGGIILREVFITIGSLNFESTSIDFILEINNCVISNLGFGIKNCQVNGPVRITTGCLSSITLFKSTFEKDIYVWAPCIVNGFIINYGHFKDDLRIQGVRGRPGLTMFSGKYDDKVSIDYEDLNRNNLIEGFRSLHFESCDFNNGLEVNGVQDVFAVAYPLIESINIKSSTRLKGDLLFNSLDVNVFKFSGINQNATIKLNAVFVNRLWFDNFSNYSKIIFNNVRASTSEWFNEIKNRGKTVLSKVDSLFQLEHTDLGSCKFWGFNFDSFKTLSFNNVVLSSCEFQSISWFESSKLGRYNSDQTKLLLVSEHNRVSIIKDYKNRREIYRQLKQVLFSQGDTIQALKFKSLEMEQYHEQIKLEKPLHEIDKWHEIGDRFSIFLNRFSNKNGLDWTRSAWLILIITFCFFLLFIAIHQPEQSNLPTLSSKERPHPIDLITSNQQIYWGLLDPTQKVKDVLGAKEGEAINGWLYFLFFLHRIILAYLIFQTIAAFRKYLK